MENQIERLKSLSAYLLRDLEQLINAYDEVLAIEDPEERKLREILFTTIWNNFYVPRAIAVEEFRKRLLKTIGDTPDRLFENIYELGEGENIQAIKKLLKTWFPKKAIFYSRVDEFNSLIEPLYTRLRETRDSEDIPQEDWEQISAKDILLAFEKMDLESLRPSKNPSRVKSVKDEKISAAYHELILRIKEEYERDIFDGARIDSKERRKVETFTERPEGMEGVKEIYDELKRQQEEQDFNEEIENADDRIDASGTANLILGTLNEKEKQLAREMMAGYSNKEIAAHLGVESSTIRKRKQKLREKIRGM